MALPWSRPSPPTAPAGNRARRWPRMTFSSCAAMQRQSAPFAVDQHLSPRTEETAATIADALFNRRSGLAEVVIPPRSGTIGQSAFPGMVTPSLNLMVLAVQRGGEDQGPGSSILAAGDTLLLQGTWSAGRASR